MATHDYVIDNQSAPAFRADLNNALLAIVSQNSGSSAPGTTYANMLWYDTGTNQVKKRNEANSAWVILGTVDEGLGTFTPTGLPAIASQAESEAGTDNVKMMTPLRAAQAIAALGGLGGLKLAAFISSGTYTPTAGYKYALVFATGGGRGGGGSAGGSSGGNGGIAGDTCISAITISGLGSQTVTIGAGGSGTSSTFGNTGGDTSLGTIVVAKGGNSATSNVGAFQIPSSPAGGSGTYVGGMGGGSFWGSGGGNSGTSGTAGSAALAYGAGGGAGYNTSGTTSGGAGRSGAVFIVEFK
jgi:hypothetical protein